MSGALSKSLGDKLALVRSVQFVEPIQHELDEVFTGDPKSEKRPSFGSVIGKFRGTDGTMPPYVSLEYAEGLVSYERPQYLGIAHRPLNIAGNDFVHNLGMAYGVNKTRFDERRALLASFDGYRRNLDAARGKQAADRFTNQALHLVSSGRAREAFDLAREGCAIATASRTTSSFTSAAKRTRSGTVKSSRSPCGWPKPACR